MRAPRNDTPPPWLPASAVLFQRVCDSFVAEPLPSWPLLTAVLTDPEGSLQGTWKQEAGCVGGRNNLCFTFTLLGTQPTQHIPRTACWEYLLQPDAHEQIITGSPETRDPFLHSGVRDTSLYLLSLFVSPGNQNSGA